MVDKQPTISPSSSTSQKPNSNSLSLQISTTMSMAFAISSSPASSPSFTLRKPPPLYSTPFISLNLKTPKSRIQIKSPHLRRRTTIIIAKSSSDDSADGPDRLISALCYFYPFFDGIQYGKYVINQFGFLQTLIEPLVPAIRVYKSFPFNGILLFVTLYFAIVRNPNFSRYVRFNAMQAIVLDVLLIFPDLLERSFDPKDGIGLDLMMSLDSTVFLFMFVSLIYGSSSCALGQLPRLPIVAEAADRQVM